MASIDARDQAVTTLATLVDRKGGRKLRPGDRPDEQTSSVLPGMPNGSLY